MDDLVARQGNDAARWHEICKARQPLARVEMSISDLERSVHRSEFVVGREPTPILFSSIPGRHLGTHRWRTKRDSVDREIASLECTLRLLT